MKKSIIFGLLGVVAVIGLSTQILFKKNTPELNIELGQHKSVGREIMLDPETGEMLTDAEKINELKAVEKAAKVKSDQKMVMTEMEGGALKVELGKRFIKPQTASLDEDGNLVKGDHQPHQSELKNEESE